MSNQSEERDWKENKSKAGVGGAHETRDVADHSPLRSLMAPINFFFLNELGCAFHHITENSFYHTKKGGR